MLKPKTALKWKKALSAVLNVVFITFMVLGSVLIFHNLYYTPVKIVGSSMYPTLSDNDFGVMDTHVSALNKLERFDIVIINYPLGSDYFIIKRVIGLPGETVSLESATGDLSINGATIEQPFITDVVQARTCTQTAGVACNTSKTLSETQYYVLGDNRGNSTDSEHGVGLIAVEQITGVLFAIEGVCREDSPDSSDGAHIRTCPTRTYHWPTFY